MGNRIASSINWCCQERQQSEEIDIKSIKISKLKGKAAVIKANDDCDLETNIKFNASENGEQFQSTANTNLPFQHKNMASLNAQVVLRVDDIKMTQKQQERMKVPFRVVKLTLSNELLKCFTHYCESTLGNFEQDSDKVNFWTLTARGHYAKIISDNFICIFTEKYFYEGEMSKNEENTYFPQGNGILVTEQGIYRGSFKNGKANGVGSYISKSTQTTFQGEWVEGNLQTGSIQNKTFKFIGKIIDGFASGQGRIIFKQEKSQFQGQFKSGLYEGDKCVLNCEQYSYIGCFKAGKKNGQGQIVQKQQKVDIKIGATRIRKYSPSLYILGEWQSDKLVKVLIKK